MDVIIVLACSAIVTRLRIWSTNVTCFYIDSTIHVVRLQTNEEATLTSEIVWLRVRCVYIRVKLQRNKFQCRTSHFISASHIIVILTNPASLYPKQELELATSVNT